LAREAIRDPRLVILHLVGLVILHLVGLVILRLVGLAIHRLVGLAIHRLVEAPGASYHHRHPEEAAGA
jgi:hypothetical protein